MNIDNKTVTQLQQERGELITEARSALDEITKNTDDSRAAELEARHDTIMGKVDAIDSKITRAERVAAAEARQQEIEAAARENKRPLIDGEGRGDEPGADAPTYRSVFAKVVCGAEMGDLNDAERVVLRTGQTNFERRAQTAGTGSAGGFTVPTELATFIDRAMKDWGPMYDPDICTVITTPSGNPMKIPTVDDTAKTAALHTEAAAIVDDGTEDVTFAQKALDAFVYDTEFVRWSFELDNDSIFAMESLLGDLLGERLARRANAALTTGTGSSQPNGVVTASALGKTAAAIAAITADELIDLQHTVNAAYRRSPKCRWMFADTTLQAIRKLKDGQGNYLYQMGDVRVGAPDQLLGKPYSINDDMAALATGAKTVLFGDFGKYYVRKVGVPVLGIMRERFWPDLGIAGLVRFDGEIGQSAAIKHLIQA